MILVGNEKSIKELAAGINIEGAVIVDPENSDKMEDYSNYFYELRKHKGMTVEKAKETLKDPLYWGVMMVKKEKRTAWLPELYTRRPIHCGRRFRY